MLLCRTDQESPNNAKGQRSCVLGGVFMSHWANKHETAIFSMESGATSLHTRRPRRADTAVTVLKEVLLKSHDI